MGLEGLCLVFGRAYSVLHRACSVLDGMCLLFGGTCFVGCAECSMEVLVGRDKFKSTQW